jgi:hypothetical protein
MLINTCQWSEDPEPCPNLCEGRTDYCGSHNFILRKRECESLKEKKKPKPIKRESEKRKGQNKEYSKLAKEYLLLYPVCEVVECHLPSNQVHHMAGRSNEMLLNTDYFLAVCPDCHQRITLDSKWALENGYSLPRTV